MNVYDLIDDLKSGKSQDWDALEDYISLIRKELINTVLEWYDMREENEAMYKLLKINNLIS